MVQLWIIVKNVIRIVSINTLIVVSVWRVVWSIVNLYRMITFIQFRVVMYVNSQLLLNAIPHYVQMVHVWIRRTIVLNNVEIIWHFHSINKNVLDRLVVLMMELISLSILVIRTRTVCNTSTVNNAYPNVTNAQMTNRLNVLNVIHPSLINSIIRRLVSRHVHRVIMQNWILIFVRTVLISVLNVEMVVHLIVYPVNKIRSTIMENV